MYRARSDFHDRVAAPWRRLCHGASLVAVLVALAGCDQFGVETPQKASERKVEEAKAIGAGCRHASRAIEDCYVLNPKVEKAAIFQGWREMDEYMRENRLEGVAPVVPRPGPKRPPVRGELDEELEPPAPSSTPSGSLAAEGPLGGSDPAAPPMAPAVAPGR